VALAIEVPAPPGTAPSPLVHVRSIREAAERLLMTVDP
jgi:hypothetical protein